MSGGPCWARALLPVWALRHPPPDKPTVSSLADLSTGSAPGRATVAAASQESPSEVACEVSPRCETTPSDSLAILPSFLQRRK